MLTDGSGWSGPRPLCVDRPGAKRATFQRGGR
jgi:hypothetical protein